MHLSAFTADGHEHQIVGVALTVDGLGECFVAVSGGRLDSGGGWRDLVGRRNVSGESDWWWLTPPLGGVSASHVVSFDNLL
ncbi:hypothetical protein GCM10023197_22450 [Gordonia humi]